MLIFLPLKVQLLWYNFHVNPSCLEFLGAIQCSISCHFWRTVNFGDLYLLHTKFIFNHFVGKVAHNSLVCVAKISCQSKNLWVTEKHSSRRSFSQRCVFCSFSCSFQDIWKPFCNHNESNQWNFFHRCVYILILNHFTI